jgi:hypothetical protein
MASEVEERRWLLALLTDRGCRVATAVPVM